MSEILMPSLSPTMEEGKVTKWLVKVGDSVKPGDLIAEIETDKATMEIEAVDAGIVGRILVAAGSENVKVNTPIALIGDPKDFMDAHTEVSNPPDGVGGPAGAERGPPVFLGPAAKRLAAESRLASGTITASGRNGRITKGDVLAAIGTGEAGIAAHDAQALPQDYSAFQMTPLARQMARQARIDTAKLSRDGRIITPSAIEDILGRRRSARAVPTRAELEPSARPGIRIGDEDERVPLDGMRKTIASRMAHSFREVPHFPMSIDVNIDGLLDIRARLNSCLAEEGSKISVTDILVRASALALMRVPEANVSFGGDHIVKYGHADIAVAVAIPGGLITPIVRGAEKKRLSEISREIKKLALDAKARKLRPTDYEGGNFTISNLGMYGIKSFSSILNEPQAMILSIGAAERRIIATDDGSQSATIMNITLTCDHRALDGTTAANFLNVLRGFIESPDMMLI